MTNLIGISTAGPIGCHVLEALYDQGFTDVRVVDTVNRNLPFLSEKHRKILDTFAYLQTNVEVQCEFSAVCAS